MKIFIRLYQLPHIGNCKTDSVEVTSNSITVFEFKKILSNKYNISIPEQRLTAKIANRMIVTLTNEFPLSFFFIRANSIIYLERIISVNKTEQINNKILKKKNPKLKYLSSLGLYGGNSHISSRSNSKQNLDTIIESPSEYNDESKLINSEKTDYIISIVKQNNYQQLKEIVEHYDIQSIDMLGSSGWNALHTASFYGYDEIENYCVNEKKCDVNVLNKERWTSLHLATFKEHEQCVRILLADEKVKIDVNVEGVGTPLHIACKRNNLKLVSLLIFKADPKYVYTLYDICLA